MTQPQLSTSPAARRVFGFVLFVALLALLAESVGVWAAIAVVPVIAVIIVWQRVRGPGRAKRA